MVHWTHTSRSKWAYSEPNAVYSSWMALFSSSGVFVTAMGLQGELSQERKKLTSLSIHRQTVKSGRCPSLFLGHPLLVALPWITKCHQRNTSIICHRRYCHAYLYKSHAFHKSSSSDKWLIVSYAVYTCMVVNESQLQEHDFLVIHLFHQWMILTFWADKWITHWPI